MFKLTYLDPGRRDLLKQLLALGAVGAGGSVLTGHAQTSTNEMGPELTATWRGNDRYAALRRASLWRTNIPERYPEVIVQATAEQDVRAALAFARDNDIQVVCRASGHSTAGAPLRNGGMMLYVTGLNRVEIDPESKTAKVQSASSMATLFSEARRHGLDFPTADCTTVALTGFILGGGIGRNCNYLAGGPVCKALLSAEVMLANGDLVTVDENNYSDIYWAMRGCGPAFFGIVMSMTLRLFDAPGAFLSSNYSFSLESLPSLLEFFDELQFNHDPQVGIALAVKPDEVGTEELLVSVTVSAFADNGPNAASEARSRLEYYVDEGLAANALTKSEFIPQDLANYMFTRPPSIRTHTDNIYTDDSTSLVPAIEHYKTRPAGLDVRLILTHNSQYHAPFGDEMCYSAAGNHFLSIYVNWTDSKLDALAYEWTDQFSKIVRPFLKSHFLNQIDTGIYPEKVRQSFSEKNWNRLAKIRKEHDPENRFFNFVGHKQ
jgi:FAD/FMN-containing dehydrogenase